MEIIIDPPMAPEANMARDQWIADEVQSGAFPLILRIYQWNQPAISLGRRQKETDRQDSLLAKKLPMVWRPTGGGAVVHTVDELTYALAISRVALGRAAASPFVLSLSPPERRTDPPILVAEKHERPVPFENLRANGLGRPNPGRINLHQIPGLFHRQIREELVRRRWIAVEDLSIATKDFTGPTTFCFSAPVCGDLLYKGKKVAGAALRAWRECILMQGSIQNLPIPSAQLLDAVTSVVNQEFQKSCCSFQEGIVS